jgi:DNA modification methylase
LPVILGDCLEVMKRMDAESVDAIVTDPPAGISFMGKKWDHDKGGRDCWIEWMTTVAVECLRVSKPGGHALVWSIPRTSHWTATAWENAGWEVRDKIDHIFGSGFPKSLDVGKQLDKSNGILFDGTAIVELKNKLILLFNNSGKTRGEIDTECGFRACNYLTLPKEGKRPDPWINILPSQEKWVKIKKVLKCEEDISNDLDALFKEAEREVIGHQTKARSVGSKSALPTLGSSVEYQTWGITLPSTDAAKQWNGWGTALKPAHEDWILLRKPIEGTVAQNVLKYGCGGINIDGCRVEYEDTQDPATNPKYRFLNNYKTRVEGDDKIGSTPFTKTKLEANVLGRFPANIIHDGSDEVVALFPHSTTGAMNKPYVYTNNGYSLGKPAGSTKSIHGKSEGSAARFFYCAKASRSERGEGNVHPTVKPLSLMRFLCRLITPPGGIILDPFAGSGSTGVAAKQEGFQSILIELEQESYETANARMRGTK